MHRCFHHHAYWLDFLLPNLHATAIPSCGLLGPRLRPDSDAKPAMSLLLLLHAAAATQLPSLDAKCTGTSKYVGSSSYSARVSTWGSVGRGGWRGAVLGPNQKIYGIPTNATSVLELDPATRKVTTFGDFGTALAPANCSGALHCGLDKWIGGVLAPTGKIIGIPCALRPARL